MMVSLDPPIRRFFALLKSRRFGWCLLLCAVTGVRPCPAVSPAAHPILVIGETSNYGTYIGEILKAEGWNEFQIESPTDPELTPDYLRAFDVVLLGETPLTTGQQNLFADYVAGGGNLIAIRPDKKLATVMGLTDASGTVENGYVGIDTRTDFGAGLLFNTLQLHCSADRYVLNGAETVAILYATFTVATPHPAVSINRFGKGRAIAFAYNLPKNIVLTRQGNPQYAGQERDGMPGVRPTDMFTNGWVNPSKNIYNQADEQMRLLTRCIETLTAAGGPLPRFWYFPDRLKSVVTLTCDGEENVEADFESEFKEIEAKGARMSLYILNMDAVFKESVAAWTARGHEIAGHPDDTQEKQNPTWTRMNSVVSDVVYNVRRRYGLTMRTCVDHWFLWCGRDHDNRPEFAAQAEIEADHGIEMDVNYAHYDYNSTQGDFLGPTGDLQGNFTGSGLPMKFADTQGRVVNVYQHLNNVYDQQYMQRFDRTAFYDCFGGLLWRSLNREVYSYISIKAHRNEYWFSRDPLWKMLDSAKANGVPVWTVSKLLDFVKMKDEASFEGISRFGDLTSFTIRSRLIHDNGLTFLVPSPPDGNCVTGVQVDGAVAVTTPMTVKGRSYTAVTVGGGTDHAVVVHTSRRPVPVTSVAILPAYTTLAPGQTVRLTAAVKPANASDPRLIWTSADTTVALVDSLGRISGVGPDTTTIRVFTADGHYSAACAVRVSSPGRRLLLGGTVEYPEGGSPAVLRFRASMAGRPAEILTETSPGCGYASGRILIQCGNFPTPWRPGDVIQIDVQDGESRTGSIEAALTGTTADSLRIVLSAAPEETVNVFTNPAGLHFFADGIEYTGSHVFHWRMRTHHILSADSLEDGDPGTRRVFRSWNRRGDRILGITVDSAAVYEADFTTQVRLALAADPDSGGSVTTVAPIADGWIDAGDTVMVQAIPRIESEYLFAGWFGDLAGTANPALLVMNNPRSVSASFRKRMKPAPRLSGRWPGPDAVDVPENAEIRLTIAPGRPNDGIADSTLGVWLNGTPVVSKGADLTLGGAAVRFGSSDATVLVRLLPDTTERVVSVRIQCRASVQPSAVLDTTYRFSTYGARVRTLFRGAIGPAGGIVGDDSAGLAVLVPPGALADSVDLSAGPVDRPPVLCDSLFAAGRSYYFGPDGLCFSDSVQVRIPFTLADLDSAGVTKCDDLPVFFFSTTDGRWTRLKGHNPWASWNPMAGFIQVRIERFGYLSIGKRRRILSGVGRDVVETLPARFGLSQNFPNPFNPSTMIRFETGNPCRVILKVFDLQGREVATLADGFYPAGPHTVRFDGQGLASGIYVYRIRMGSFQSARKMERIE
jgi:hypothetical protein